MNAIVRLALFDDERRLAKRSDVNGKNLQRDVMAFLVANPNPDGEALHAWAEEQGYVVPTVELEAYRLATIAALFLSTGKSAKGFDDSTINSEQMARGMKVEQEHIEGPKEIVDLVTRKIAKDHFVENSEYYQISDAKVDVLYTPKLGD